MLKVAHAMNRQASRACADAPINVGGRGTGGLADAPGEPVLFGVIQMIAIRPEHRPTQSTDRKESEK